MNKDYTREDILKMSEEEVNAWIHDTVPGSEEHIRRHNKVYWDCGLTRLGIDISKPTISGELKLEPYE